MTNVTKEQSELGRVFLRVRDICGDKPDLVTLETAVDTLSGLANFVSVKLVPHRNEEVQKVEDLMSEAWTKLYDAKQALKVLIAEKEVI